MRNNKVSSAYVVDDMMKFKGIATIDECSEQREIISEISDILITDVKTTYEDVLLNDIIMAATTPFPITVIDRHDSSLMGMKADVLSSINWCQFPRFCINF